jgi:hypothetical protein
LDDEITRYNYMWDSDNSRLIFPLWAAGKIVFTNSRSFDGGPKYVNTGSPPEDRFLGTGRTIIFVEDAVSAIKVARHTTAYPLFGSIVPARAINLALERAEAVGVWLDPDKRGESLKTVLRARVLDLPLSGIVTDKDPKEHTDKEILGEINKVEQRWNLSST